MLKKLWKSIKLIIFVGRRVKYGKNFTVGLGSFVSSAKSLKIGDDVYVGKYCSIQCNGSIGSGVLIANNVGIVGRRDHDFRQIGTCVRSADWVGDSERLASDPKNSVEIGDDVWLGFGAIVLSGVKIGRGAIISAGAVVLDDIVPYDIVAGNPAKPVARRFSDEQIARHERMLSGGHN